MSCLGDLDMMCATVAYVCFVCDERCAWVIMECVACTCVLGSIMFSTKKTPLYQIYVYYEFNAYELFARKTSQTRNYK